MPIIDASVVVALTLRDNRAPAAQALLRGLLAAGETLHAPALLPYEVASGLTRAAVSGDIAPTLVAGAWRWAMALPLHYHLLAEEEGETAMAIARRLRRQSACDAAYLALARALDTEVWTFDRKLARNAGELGYPVKLVEEAA